MKSELQLALGAGAARLALDALLGSCRFHDIGTEPFRALIAQGQPVIFALWHGRLLALSYRFRNNGFVPLISKSADGEYIARVVQGWGYSPVRGSASRGGGEALRELVRETRAGRSIVLTPDGPRGPFHELKHGVLTIAQLSGCPIIPAASAATHGWFFGRWDRFLVPRPLSRIYVVFGEPIYVPRALDADTLAAKHAEVTRALNAVLEDADARARAR